MKFQILIGYRNMCGCTQADFSTLINLKTPQAYNLKENGKTPFTLNEMKTIKSFINSKLGKTLTIDEIFS